MAVATYDIQDTVGRNRPQSSRRVEIPFVVDFSQINSGAGLVAGEDAAFGKTPKGFVYEDHNAFLLTAEGAAGNIDVGTEGDPDGLLDGGDVNSAAPGAIAKAGTESINAGRLMSETELRVSIAAAQPTIDTAIVKLVMIGYIIDGVAA